jgi:hypothetical protein
MYFPTLHKQWQFATFASEWIDPEDYASESAAQSIWMVPGSVDPMDDSQ